MAVVRSHRGTGTTGAILLLAGVFLVGAILVGFVAYRLLVARALHPRSAPPAPAPQRITPLAAPSPTPDVLLVVNPEATTAGRAVLASASWLLSPDTAAEGTRSVAPSPVKSLLPALPGMSPARAIAGRPSAGLATVADGSSGHSHWLVETRGGTVAARSARASGAAARAGLGAEPRLPQTGLALTGPLAAGVLACLAAGTHRLRRRVGAAKQPCRRGV